MKPNTVIERFKAARLYAITCLPSDGPSGYPAMVGAACAGGADIIQFRDKEITGRQRYEMAAALRQICARHKVLFIVNDALEVALACGADGVHLGQDDLPLETARKLVRSMGRQDFLIGRSTHNLAQALEAERQGADYIAVGPIFATPTKPTYAPVGLEILRAVAGRVRVPQVAIGGIDASNIGEVLTAGATRVAVVRAVCGAPDIAQAARHLKALLQSKMETRAL
jgi:thiamine-phosphate pyrophosphorylase